MKVVALNNKRLLKAKLASYIFHYKSELWKSLMQASLKGKMASKLDDKSRIQNVVTQYNGDRYIIKKTAKGKSVNFEVALIIHEAFMLRFLLKHSSKIRQKYNIRFPLFYGLRKNQHTYCLQREYVPGKTLNNFHKTFQLEALGKYLEFLHELNLILKPADIKKLPKRGNFYLFLMTPFYMARLSIKDAALFFETLNLMLTFGYLWCKTVRSKELQLSHRDIHFQNLLVEKGELIVLDYESFCLSPKFTDIAITSRLLSESLSLDDIQSLISKFIVSRFDFMLFLKLTLFYSFQSLAFEKKNSKYYLQTKKYLHKLKEFTYQPTVNIRPSIQII